VATDESSSSSDADARAAYREKLRSLRFHTSGSQSRLPFREKPDGSWEKGIQGERRADGSFMPYVHASDLTPITAKQMADNRRSYESQLREIRGATPEE
jgi:hypothetical protein